MLGLILNAFDDVSATIITNATAACAVVVALAGWTRGELLQPRDQRQLTLSGLGLHSLSRQAQHYDVTLCCGRSSLNADNAGRRR